MNEQFSTLVNQMIDNFKNQSKENIKNMIHSYFLYSSTDSMKMVLSHKNLRFPTIEICTSNKTYKYMINHECFYYGNVKIEYPETEEEHLTLMMEYDIIICTELMNLIDIIIEAFYE